MTGDYARILTSALRSRTSPKEGQYSPGLSKTEQSIVVLGHPSRLTAPSFLYMSAQQTHRVGLMASGTTLDMIKPGLSREQVKETTEAVQVLFRLDVVGGHDLLSRPTGASIHSTSC